MPEPSILMCVRLDGKVPLQDSIVSRCCVCHLEVWISVSGQKLIERNPSTEVVCVQCGYKQVQAEKQPTVGIVEGAFDEFIDNFLHELFP